jgi:hypothetical protein
LKFMRIITGGLRINARDRTSDRPLNGPVEMSVDDGIALAADRAARWSPSGAAAGDIEVLCSLPRIYLGKRDRAALDHFNSHRMHRKSTSTASAC